ncbi:Chemotaxis protein PomA [Pseudovibrio axinellae]|uniref:Chemotaxis protein PomA n=1 Tax=Pseudovibrio axinellae TaxID=989403 RepID=A0A166A954_9HYPH|nr:MotA/TolQ/ExbB proton channel family protein [Pseudovibrio axinellae]KZL20747.1 Chemotaxis protein PomA [Pseudovibrio axinellae]SER23899.1 chemotaxis protein MotA [Pseudovibrio axinellae]
MDLATIIGVLAACVTVLIAIFLGGSFSQFVDLPSILIVFGGGLAATLVRFPLTGLLSAFGMGAKLAFTHKKIEPRELVENIAHLAETARKEGPLGLENVEIAEPTLAKGVQFVADGYDYSLIRDTMEKERDLFLNRLNEGARVYRALGDSAPAFGMIGTLVGLVQMLATMDDPSTIGPSMAIALLTTLYGSLIANIVCIPVADKLDSKFEQEELNQTLVIDGVLQIRESKSPSLIREMLLAYIPEKGRSDMAEAAA